jgi:Dyp-type peroxidase family
MTSQHAWEATFGADDLARPVLPAFHRLVMLDVIRAPARADVRRMELVLRGLEGRYRHGPDGLLMLVGWGPGYFTRHTDGPAPIGRPVPLARDERAVMEDIDVCIHLAADDEGRLNAIVAELLGDGAMALGRALELREVRTGFAGPGLPAKIVGGDIPRDAPLLLGFHSGLRRNQATEDEVTIEHGPLAGGTTMHVSRLALDLDAWYRLDADRRAALMYAPTVSASSAATLAEDAPSDFERLPDTASAYGVVGHAQAAARARLGGRPRLNRRDFATIDGGIPGTHFVSLQRHLEDFNATRAVMNAADAHHHHASIGLRRNNGINQFMHVLSRATFAVPVRAGRAYPGVREALQPRRVPDHEPGELATAARPARPALGQRDRVEPPAGDFHPHVAGVGIHRDPPARARVAPALKRP